MLIIFGVLFIVIENYNKGRKPVMNSIAEITWKAAIGVGLFQLIAAVFRNLPFRSYDSRRHPSRHVPYDGSRIHLLPGRSRYGRASLLKLVKFGLAFSASEAVILIVGMVVAFVVSIIVIKFLLNYIRRNDFKAFGWYRIVLGVLVILFFSL